ncbi:PP2C family protein-serine/threonine phosphatase [Streptomyces sp. DH7]|uniref:PP2C family protein-serine/threonine phosphatase n=1 Tax=Streptomyces sp. DH7 TaxID=2857006 RepID=UPI001E53125A|nr:PP2C family protein-serine/threonine phosphatase [Streptomyces sp. DH7]
MTSGERGIEEMLVGLLKASHLMSVDELPAKVAEYAPVAGLLAVDAYVCDLQESVLRRVTGEGMDAAQGDGDSEFKVEGTLPGRAFQQGEVLPTLRKTQQAGHYQWWVPFLDGTERLGVLRVTTDANDEQAHTAMQSLAALMALIIVSKRENSDSHARLVRTQEMNVAAEMQWHLMPPRSYADARVMIAGAMEPAYQVAGDAFDFAIASDTVHLAIFDAMGHDTAAGLTANLAMAACRNHRRQGAPLNRIGEAIEQVLTEQFADRIRYVTAILADLDTRTGRLSWVNHGHHPPVIIRGHRWTNTVHCPPTPPLGVGLGLEATLCHEQLHPGDRIVLYTDGITEARSPGGQEFGLDRFLDFLIRQHADDLPVPETLRRLRHRILDHHGSNLSDDATVLILEWHGRTPYPLREVEALAGLPDQ